MNARTQGFLAFGVATFLVAVFLGVGLRFALRHAVLHDLPSVSQGEMPTSFLSSASATRWVYSGALPASNGQTEWISVSFPDPGAPRISITVVLSHGEGALSLLGLVDASTGRFEAGLTNRSVGFPHFEALSGTVRGPALLDGVPALWLEADSSTRTGKALAEPRRWSGVLYAEGFGH